MSEHLFRFLLSEVVRVRLVCKGCGDVAEVSVARLANKIISSCPLCAAPYEPGGDAGQTLQEFAEAVEKLRRLKRLEVEIALPAPPDAPPTP